MMIWLWSLFSALHIEWGEVRSQEKSSLNKVSQRRITEPICRLWPGLQGVLFINLSHVISGLSWHTL